MGLVDRRDLSGPPYSSSLSSRFSFFRFNDPFRFGPLEVPRLLLLPDTSSNKHCQRFCCTLNEPGQQYACMQRRGRDILQRTKSSIRQYCLTSDLVQTHPRPQWRLTGKQRLAGHFGHKSRYCLMDLQRPGECLAGQKLEDCKFGRSFLCLNMHHSVDIVQVLGVHVNDVLPSP